MKKNNPLETLTDKERIKEELKKEWRNRRCSFEN